MKISDSIETTSGLHVFETPEDLIINSQVYDKFTMEPKPYNFFNIQTLANKNLLLHEINILEYNICNPSKEPEYNYYIQDNQNSSIFYCLLEIGKNDQNQYLHKIQKSNNSYKLLKSISPDADYHNTYVISTVLHYKIIGQTKDYILLSQVNAASNWAASFGGCWGRYFAPVEGASSNGLSYIVVKKSNMTNTVIDVDKNHTDSGTYLIKETEDKIYVLEFIDGAIYISSINPPNNTRTVLYSHKNFNDNETIGISNVIKFRDKYCTIIGNLNYNRRYILSFSFSNIGSVENVEIQSIDNTNIFPVWVKNGRNDSLGDAWLRYSLKNIDDNYIHITTHNNQNKQNGRPRFNGGSTYYSYYIVLSFPPAFTSIEYTLADNGMHRHYLLKMNNDKTWSVKSMINPLNQQQFIYGVLYFDNLTPIFHLQTGVEIYKLDLNTETYNKVFDASGTFQTIGLDENNNFYTFDVNNKCNIYNRNSCSTINGKFEYDSYNYDNEDIETNVTIASKNFIGELISSKIHVELSGNCKFRNGKQEATLNTRLDLEYEVPVIITGPGVVYCNINEVE